MKTSRFHGRDYITKKRVKMMRNPKSFVDYIKAEDRYLDMRIEYLSFKIRKYENVKRMFRGLDTNAAHMCIYKYTKNRKTRKNIIKDILI